MRQHGSATIDRTPSRGAVLKEMIPQSLAKAHEGLFFIVFIGHDKGHQHPK